MAREWLHSNAESSPVGLQSVPSTWPPASFSASNAFVHTSPHPQAGASQTSGRKNVGHHSRPPPPRNPRPGQRESLPLFFLTRATELNPWRITGGGQGVGEGLGWGGRGAKQAIRVSEQISSRKCPGLDKYESEGLSRRNILGIIFLVCLFLIKLIIIICFPPSSTALCTL